MMNSIISLAACATSLFATAQTSRAHKVNSGQGQLMLMRDVVDSSTMPAASTLEKIARNTTLLVVGIQQIASKIDWKKSWDMLQDASLSQKTLLAAGAILATYLAYKLAEKIHAWWSGGTWLDTTQASLMLGALSCAGGSAAAAAADYMGLGPAWQIVAFCLGAMLTAQLPDALRKMWNSLSSKTNQTMPADAATNNKQNKVLTSAHPKEKPLSYDYLPSYRGLLCITAGALLYSALISYTYYDHAGGFGARPLVISEVQDNALASLPEPPQVITEVQENNHLPSIKELESRLQALKTYVSTHNLKSDVCEIPADKKEMEHQRKVVENNIKQPVIDDVYTMRQKKDQLMEQEARAAYDKKNNAQTVNGKMQYPQQTNLVNPLVYNDDTDPLRYQDEADIAISTNLDESLQWFDTEHSHKAVNAYATSSIQEQFDRINNMSYLGIRNILPQVF